MRPAHALSSHLGLVPCLNGGIHNRPGRAFYPKQKPTPDHSLILTHENPRPSLRERGRRPHSGNEDHRYGGGKQHCYAFQAQHRDAFEAEQRDAFQAQHHDAFEAEYRDLFEGLCSVVQTRPARPVEGKYLRVVVPANVEIKKGSGKCQHTCRLQNSPCDSSVSPNAPCAHDAKHAWCRTHMVFGLWHLVFPPHDKNTITKNRKKVTP